MLAGLSLLCSFLMLPSKSETVKWIEDCLKGRFNSAPGNAKLKKWELSLSDKGFFRLRKFYPKGKQEYFSFNVSRFNDLDYIGSVDGGELWIKTVSDDIIVQTYNDPKGNIDSMSSKVVIPLLNVEPELLDSLRNGFFSLKSE